MAFPATSTTNHDAWLEITRTAQNIKDRVQSLRDLSASSSVPRQFFIQQQAALTEALNSWSAIIAASDNAALQEYARGQVNDPTLNIVAEYVAMRDAAIDLRQWIFDNMPKDAGTGAALTFTTTLEGTTAPITVSTVQSQVYRDKADVFLATIS